MSSVSYHDLYVETKDIPRTRLFDMPFAYSVTCTRVGGWALFYNDLCIAGEYGDPLLLDVAGVPICDSFIGWDDGKGD
jgi:hypothetical protein